MITLHLRNICLALAVAAAAALTGADSPRAQIMPGMPAQLPPLQEFEKLVTRQWCAQYYTKELHEEVQKGMSFSAFPNREYVAVISSVCRNFGFGR
jgi:hypothetical protein